MSAVYVGRFGLGVRSGLNIVRTKYASLRNIMPRHKQCVIIKTVFSEE